MAIGTKQILLLLVGLALLAGLIWLLVILKPLLVALTIAALLAYLLNPLVGWLTKRLRGKRSLAAVVVYVLILGVIAGLFGAVGAMAWEQWPRLQAELVEALVVMEGWLTRPLLLYGFKVEPDAVWANLETAVANALSSFAIGTDGLLAGLTDNLLWSLVVFVSLFYLLKDGHRLVPGLLQLTPRAYRPVLAQLLTEIDLVWRVFLRVQLFIFVVLTVLLMSSTALIIWLFRQGWLSLSPLGLVLLLVAVYTAIQQVDNLWLRPQLMGHALKIHPGLTFVGLIAGLALGGLLGALLIVPVLATIKVIGRFVYLHLAGELRSD